MEREIKKIIPFTLASIRIKQSAINLTKYVKDLYLENYRTRRKKLKKMQKIESTYRVHGEEELPSLKCPHYPKQSIDSMQFLSRFQRCISQN